MTLYSDLPNRKISLKEKKKKKTFFIFNITILLGTQIGKMEFTKLIKDDKEAIIFLPENEIESVTKTQILSMIANEACKNIRCMPDCHAGAGCVVGLTSLVQLNPPMVIPNFIGVDIGCGMYAYKMTEEIKKKLRKEKHIVAIENAIKSSIKMGMNVNEPDTSYFDVVDVISHICAQSQLEAIEFAMLYEKYTGINISNFVPTYSNEWLKNKCKEIKVDYSYVIRSIGTLGGGNHFIECGRTEKTDDVYIVIHSGSRNFGLKICNYHQGKLSGKNPTTFAKNIMKKRMDEMIENAKTKSEMKHIQKRKKEIIEQIEYEMKTRTGDFKDFHGEILMNEDAFEYIFDMIFAQKYATFNRKCMMKIIHEVIGQEFDLFTDSKTNAIESIHNYIDFLIDTEKGIMPTMRKGAISAKLDEICIIPMNMRDGTLICRGLGNAMWNFSAPHGAGRVYGRLEAKRTFTLKEFEDTMKDVYSTSVCKETIDEAPFVYKDMELIKKMITWNGNPELATVEILDRIIPIFNIKDDTGSSKDS